MVPFLALNLDETTLAWPLQGGSQAQQEPNSGKAPMVEAEHEENPPQGKGQEAQHAGNWNIEKQAQQKVHAAQCQIPEDLPLR